MNWGLSKSNLPNGQALRAVCAMLVCALALLAQPAHAQTQSVATATGTAQAAIVETNTLFATQPMDFGRIAPRATAGTVILEPTNGTCSVTGAILQFDRCQAGEFVGMGRRRFIVRISLPASVTLTGPGGTMLLDTLTLDTSPDLALQGGNGNGNGNAPKRYEIVSPTGIYAFTVGGTLRVGANQAAGTYTGTYAVTAVYQ